jgi:hypothetical protein
VCQKCKQKEVKEMNQSISKILVAMVLAATVGVQAKASVSSKTIVVELPSDLPELARGRSDAMYLHHTHEAQAILYLEQDHGRKLAILDVTDPANIKAVGQVSITAPATYDFVQYLGGSRTLIHYRDHSGYAVISFKNFKQPVLTPEPEYLHPSNVQSDGPNGLLLVSSSGTSAPARPSEFEILNISNSSDAKPLATVQGVIQRVDRPETGTIFLLNDQGVTVVRCLATEHEHQTEEWQKDTN